LGVFIKRGREVRLEDLEMLASELEGVTQLSRQKLVEEMAILEVHKFATIDADEQPPRVIAYSPLESGWPFWRDLRTFCNKTGHDIDRVISEIRFDVLDEPE
jgi:hypothetical protein